MNYLMSTPMRKCFILCLDVRGSWILTRRKGALTSKIKQSSKFRRFALQPMNINSRKKDISITDTMPVQDISSRTRNHPKPKQVKGFSAARSASIQAGQKLSPYDDQDIPSLDLRPTDPERLVMLRAREISSVVASRTRNVRYVRTRAVDEWVY